MIQLTDTQAVILSAAAQREGHIVLPLPATLRGGAARNVVAALLKRGLIAETTTDSHVNADVALNQIWRNDADSASTSASEATSAVAPEEAPAEASPVPRSRPPRQGTKQAMLIEMLRREGGVTIDEIVAATAWRHHTVRGYFAGALKKKLGLEVTSEKVEGKERVYRLSILA